MAQKKSTATSSSEKKQIKEMGKKIADLNNVIQMLLKQSSSTVNNGDRDVVFISLCNNILNLSTEPYGSGTIYTFTEFGEEQSIPLSDARKIIKSNKNFIKGGKCYIADTELISMEHLDNDYKKILNKDALLQLLNKNRSDFRSIFDTLTTEQKEIFRDIVVKKLTTNPDSVDMNIVQHINNSLNTDLLQNIEYGKKLFENEE